MARMRVRRRNALFWSQWDYYDRPPYNIRRQIFSVVSRMNKFVITDWNADSFIFDVVQRCIIAYDKFDGGKSGFVSWVVMNARSVADNIIRTSRFDSRSEEMGRGARWPYNSKFEPTFSDIEASVRESGVDVDIGDMEFMAEEIPEDMLIITHEWAVRQLEKGGDNAKIVGAAMDGYTTIKQIMAATGLPANVVGLSLRVMKIELWRLLNGT